MKQLSALFASLALSTSLLAQSDCGAGRYLYPPSFDSVTVTTGIQYGNNTAVAGGGNQILRMDVYEPAGDTLQDRPVVLVAFGGSFIGGSREDVAELCERFAALGYVAVAPDYRVGFFFPNSNTTQLAVTRCMHDLRGCIRFLRKSVAEDGDPWRIDPERIIVGGVSAGGIGAVQVAYLDQSSEIPPVLYDDTLSIGAIQGNSGSAGYPSHVSAAWSMSGAIGDTSWIQTGDVPLVSLHEVGDGVVPYGTEEVSVIGIPTGLVASGSSDIHLRMDNVGVPNCFFSYPGNGHVGYLTSDLENAVGKVAAFLAEVVCALPITCGNLATGGLEDPSMQEAPSVFPNPTTGLLNVFVQTSAWVQVCDAQGRTVLQQRVVAGQQALDLSAQPAGLYTLRFIGVGVRTERVVIQ